MANKKSNKKTLIIVVSIVAAVIVLSTASFFIYHFIFHPHPYGNFRDHPNQMMLNNTIINQTENFFNSNPNNQSVQNYCNQNQFYCGYYCTRINSTNTACGDVQTAFNRTSPPMMKYPGGQQ